MVPIAHALARIKGELTDMVPEALVRGLLDRSGRSFRNRTLPPVVTTYLALRQVLHGNTAAAGVRHLAGLDFSRSAYCQARARLSVGFFQRLLRAVTGRLRAGDPERPGGRWYGHRVWLVDGPSFSMPATAELQETFGPPGGPAPGCGFPVAHVLALFEAATGYVLRVAPAPLRTHDPAGAAAAHPELARGDVLVGDRAFGSFAHLALLRRRAAHGLFRARQRRRRGRRRDRITSYRKPPRKPPWMTDAHYAALPEHVTVREVRVRVTTPGGRVRVLTLVTTLLDRRRYPAAALARLYERRGRAEVDLRHLKQTLGLDVPRPQTVPGVVKELLAFVVVYNLVRRVMREAAVRQGVAAERLSFVDALRWLRRARPGSAVPVLVVNPGRPGRVEPRACKRRPKQYPRMTRPRAVLRQGLQRQEVAA